MMAVAENAGVIVCSPSWNLQNKIVSAESKPPEDLDASGPKNDSLTDIKESYIQGETNDQSNIRTFQHRSHTNGATQTSQNRNETSGSGDKDERFPQDGGDGYADHVTIRNSNGAGVDSGKGGGRLESEMSLLEDMLSKLNPMAKEFVPPSLAYASSGAGVGNNFLFHRNSVDLSPHNYRRKKNSYGQGKRRMNKRTSLAQREEVIRRTVYVSDIDHQVTEEQLAGLFSHCGQVVDCRICGDPNSILRFAFVEFMDEESARTALNLSGTMLGFYPVRVLPSKTAIAPVNPTFLPRSEDEREMCTRTIYCANIDKKVTQRDVRLFFESVCGEVQQLRLLGDRHHQTNIAFVEFSYAESAILALSCSGAVVGSLPIRVSPSKTPVRPRAPRPNMH